MTTHLFQLTDYDPSQPALYVHKDGSMEWRSSPQNAKMMYYERQQAIICKPEDFARLPESLVKRLMREFDVDNLTYLWQACRVNVSFNAPGSELHGTTPVMEVPPPPRSTVRTRRRGLRVIKSKMLEFTGPAQAMHIARWLADQHPDRVVDDDQVEQSLYLMQRINPVKTRQGIVHVYKYYRSQYIRVGGLVEA